MNTPEQVQIMLTERCNLKCTHCCVPFEDSPAAGELGTSDWKRFIDHIARAGVRSLVLSGGEALLRRDAIELVTYGLDRGIPEAVIVTNVVWRRRGLVEELARALDAYPGLGLQISLDGASAATHDWLRGDGAFEALVTGIAELRRLGGRVNGVNSVIHRRNIHEFDAIVELAASIGARNWRVFTLASLGRARKISEQILPPEDWRAIFARIELLRRSTGMDIITIGPVHGYDWPASVPDEPRPASEVPSRALIGPDGAMFTCPPLRHRAIGSVSAIESDADWGRSVDELAAIQKQACSTCCYRLLCVGTHRDEPLRSRGAECYVVPT